MATQMANRPLVPMDDLLLALAETSAHAALTVEALQQRAEGRQFRTVKGNDGLVGLHRPSGNTNRLAAIWPARQAVPRAAADQLVPGDVAVLERTTALLWEQVKLITRLSEELAEERQRRRAAESATADLQGQLTELGQNPCAATSGLASGDDGMVRITQDTCALAEMEDQAKEWRRRSRKRPGSARRRLRKGMKRLLTRLLNRRLAP